MKRFYSILILALAGSSLLAAELVESVVARVGDRIITRSQYNRRLSDGLEELRQSTPPAEQREKIASFKKELINEMLSELLIKDRADRLGLTVTPQEIQDGVKRLKAQYGIESDEQFNESLQKSGLTRPEMEARLRETLLTNKVFQRELRGREDLTDRELRERYDREKDTYRLPERAKVREIVLLTPEGATAEQIEAIRVRADEAAQKARGGADFPALAKQYSESATKDDGGSLGEVARGELQSALDSAVFNLNGPGVAGPVQSRFGFHILKVDERLPSEVPSFDSVKERLRKDASDQTFQRDYKAYIERLRKDAYIQINEAQIPAG